MTPEQQNEVVQLLIDKFNGYSNCYVTKTDSLTVEQLSYLRRVFYDKDVEMQVAGNSLIKKALQTIHRSRFKGIYEPLDGVTAVLFPVDAKKPALALCSFKTDKAYESKIKAAFISQDNEWTNNLRMQIGENARIETEELLHQLVDAIRKKAVMLELRSIPSTTRPIEVISAGASTPENKDWKKIETIYSRILEITSTGVVLECLVDEANKEFENRRFDRDLLEKVMELEEGKLIMIQIFSLPGEIRFTFTKGDGVIDPSLFDVIHDFSDIELQLQSLNV